MHQSDRHILLRCFPPPFGTMKGSALSEEKPPKLVDTGLYGPLKLKGRMHQSDRHILLRSFPPPFGTKKGFCVELRKAPRLVDTGLYGS